MRVSRGCLLFGFLGAIVGAGKDFVYRLILSCLLAVFLFLRFPYLFDLGWFAAALLILIFPVFVSLAFSRLLRDGFSSFFSGFVPAGTPIWISPFVCCAETLSFSVRPLVLLARPLLNISIGAYGGAALGLMFLSSGTVALALIFLFFYEIFVALVHWFIVSEILSFSSRH